jgi:hypothetical protein
MARFLYFYPSFMYLEVSMNDSTKYNECLENENDVVVNSCRFEVLDWQNLQLPV